MEAGLRTPLLDFFRHLERHSSRHRPDARVDEERQHPGLARKEPQDAVASSLTLMHRLNDRDVRNLSIDRNVPETLRIAARKKLVQGRP